MRKNHIIFNTNPSGLLTIAKRENPVKLWRPERALYVPSHDEAQAIIKKYNLYKGAKNYV